jgi:phage-related protein (TIGR01555 family)
MDFAEQLGRAFQRVDGWVNLATSVGSAARQRFQFQYEVRLDDATLENLYFGDAYASRVCKTVPEEALRRGFGLKIEMDDEASQHGPSGSREGGASADIQAASSLMAQLDAMHVPAKMIEAWTWGRLFGGAALLVGANDGKDPAEPLDLDTLQSVDYVSVVDKRWLFPIDWFRDPMRPNFGEPSVYQMNRQGAVSIDARRIHASRIIRFDGAMTNPQRRFANQGWSESELQRVYTALKKFNGAYEAVELLLQEASQGVLKIKNLFSMLAQDNDDRLKKRLVAMDMGRSVARAIMLDADGEDFERVEVGALSGLPDTLGKFIILLSGAAEIPVTVLMGQAPAGLSATGDSDIRTFYDRIDSQRRNYLKPRLLRLATMFCAAKNGPTGGVVPRLDVAFPSMYALTPQEESDMRQKQAQTDAAYIQAGVLTPEEVGLSRFRPEGWSPETTIETELRAPVPAGAANDNAGDETAEPATSIADEAMNGAQVTSLQGIVTAAAANQLPVETAREIIKSAFPTMPDDRLQRMLAPIGAVAGNAAQLQSLQSDHASLQRSHTSLKNTLKRLMAKYGVKGSPVAIGGSGAGISDADLDAAVSEIEQAEEQDAGGGAPTNDAPDAPAPKPEVA